MDRHQRRGAQRLIASDVGRVSIGVGVQGDADKGEGSMEGGLKYRRDAKRASLKQS